jgi:nucleoid DNA-binding protein
MAGITNIAKSAETSDEVVRKVFNAIVDATKKGGTVMIKNFGTFKIKTRAARLCHNPQKPGEKVKIPERQVLVFKQSSNLKI